MGLVTQDLGEEWDLSDQALVDYLWPLAFELEGYVHHREGGGLGWGKARQVPEAGVAEAAVCRPRPSRSGRPLRP